MAASPLLGSESLYAFTLPVELLEALALRPIYQEVAPVQAVASKTIIENVFTSLGCAACGVGTFESLEEQRGHFSTDWHRYNVRVRLGNDGKAPVGEEAFAALVDGASADLNG